MSRNRGASARGASSSPRSDGNGGDIGNTSFFSSAASSPSSPMMSQTSPNFNALSHIQQQGQQGQQQSPRRRHSMAAVMSQIDQKSLTEKLLSNVSASDLAQLDPNFTSGVAEALVVIRRRRKSSSKVIKGTMQHLAGTAVSDFDDHYYLLRVWAPENDPGGALLFVLKIQRPDTGDFFVNGVELVIPVRGVVGVAAHSISDGDPVKHFRINQANTSHTSGRARVLASFVQGQVALDIKVDPGTVDQQMKKKNITRITGNKKAADLKDGRLILCFESMEERDVWLDFLTNLLMDVETADLRLEELNRRRRNRTIGPSGAVTEASLLGAIENSKLPPPPKPIGVSPEDITRYRLYHFKNNDNGGDGNGGKLGNVVVGDSQSLQQPPSGGELKCRLRSEVVDGGAAAAAPIVTKRKISAKDHGSITIQLSAVSSQTIDLTNSVIQATSPYSEPFHILKVPHDAASAAEEKKNGGPIKVLECRAKDPEDRQKWIEWLVFVKGIPQTEDETYTYREVEKKVESEKKNREINLDAGENTVTSQSQLLKKASNLRHLAVGNNNNSSSAAFSDRSSRTSAGSHVYSKNKKLNKVHDAWRDFTFGHDEEVVVDPRTMKDLLYDTSIDWSLPRQMLPMPTQFTHEEQLKMSRKKEEIKQQKRVEQLRAMQQAEQHEEELRQIQAQNDENLYQYSDNVIENEQSLEFRQMNSSSPLGFNSPVSRGFNNNTNENDNYTNTNNNNNNQYNNTNNNNNANELMMSSSQGGGSSWTQQMALMLSNNSNDGSGGGYHTSSNNNMTTHHQSSSADFVTRGCWAYVQLNAQGMPPMVEEASFSLRYFFACFGGCIPGQRATLGRLLVMNGEDLSKPWFNCLIDDVVGFQVGSRAAGPLSFVLRIRDTNSGGAVLRMTVVCSCVAERSIMLHFLQRTGGLDQIPATLVSDFRDGANSKLFIGRKTSRRPVATPNTVFDLIDTHVRDGGWNDEEVDEIDPHEAFVARNQHEQQQIKDLNDDRHQFMIGNNSNHHQRQRQGSSSDADSSSRRSSTARDSSSSQHTSSSSDIVSGEYSYNAKNSLSAPPPPHVSRTAPSSPQKNSASSTTGDNQQNNKYFTLGRLSTEHASPHPKVVPESYNLATMSTDQPTSCQLCGSPNKSECALCKATGLFHPEFLSARAAERSYATHVTGSDYNDNDDGTSSSSLTTSILHFMPPMTVMPRQDVAVSFKRFVDSSIKSNEVPQLVKYKQDSEKLSRAVLERYAEECMILAEEADLHLFAASVEGYGPNYNASNTSASRYLAQKLRQQSENNNNNSNNNNNNNKSPATGTTRQYGSSRQNAPTVMSPTASLIERLAISGGTGI